MELLLLKGEVWAEPKDDLREIVGGSFQELEEPLFLDRFVFRGDFIEHGFSFVIPQAFVFHPLHLSVNPENRLGSGNQMEVGRPLFVHQFEKCVDFCHGLPVTR